MLREEKLIDEKVTYSIFKDGKFIIIENVPARVNQETGEQFFSPKTVEKIQKLILGIRNPKELLKLQFLSFRDHQFAHPCVHLTGTAFRLSNLLHNKKGIVILERLFSGAGR